MTARIDLAKAGVQLSPAIWPGLPSGVKNSASRLWSGEIEQRDAWRKNNAWEKKTGRADKGVSVRPVVDPVMSPQRRYDNVQTLREAFLTGPAGPRTRTTFDNIARSIRGSR
jgi:hypothetical protein